MSELKTRVNNNNVMDFIASVRDEVKKQDCIQLVGIFILQTGEEPKMWGANIVGFGQYHYKSQRSRQEGDWMITGFRLVNKA
mgnify:CR=1 FL=1